MCEADASAGQVAEALPRDAAGPAVDPIGLEPVDELVITTLVDNTFDALLDGDSRVGRVSFAAASVTAEQFDGGRTQVGLRAEHGFAALLTVRRGAASTSLLYDAGLSPDALVDNADRLGVDLAGVQAVVLSHGHFDHAGGLAGLAARIRSLPMVLHPSVWTRRRQAPAGSDPVELPTLSRRAVEGEGFQVIERREPSVLADAGVLVTGEVDRTTEFEHGMPPPHQAFDGRGWRHDALVPDDQALVVNVRGRGLVVLTGCGHAGAINIVRHAMRLTGASRLHGLVGGMHLGGPAFAPVIPPTVQALADLRPALLGPGHCTGWRAQHALAAAFPEAWVPPSVGSSYRVEAA